MRISSQKQNSTLVASSFQSSLPSYHDTILHMFAERRSVLVDAISRMMTDISTFDDVALRLIETLSSGHKVLVMGNGGSAAEAQHFAAELVGRFKRDRSPYAVMALTTDTAILTAVANDYGYREVFARQIAAFGQPGDLMLAFSTSGESENLLHAAQVSRERQMFVISVTGEMTSSLELLSDVTLRVPLLDTALIQEVHMVVTHMLCDIVETHLSSVNEETTTEIDVVTSLPAQEWSI